MKLRLFFPLIFLLTIGFICCNNNASPTNSEEEAILTEEKMVSILLDIHLSEAALIELQHQGKTATKLAPDFYEKIWEKHQTESETFDKSLKHYSADINLIEGIYDKVLEELSKLESIGFDSTFVAEKK